MGTGPLTPWERFRYTFSTSFRNTRDINTRRIVEALRQSPFAGGRRANLDKLNLSCENQSAAMGRSSKRFDIPLHQRRRVTPDDRLP
jgi:hypothetical protein